MKPRSLARQKIAWQIEPVGERCLLIRLGTDISEDTSRLVHAVTEMIARSGIPYIVDVVPAFTTVAVHFNPRLLAVGKQLPSVQLTQLIDKLLSKGVVMHTQRGQRVDVPVCYGGKYGPDLTEVAQACQLTEEQVIHAHTNTPLTLYAYFFSPGNPFAGQMDARIHVPRRQTPRTRVEAGSVAIANSLTSIYQMASPGGWNVIGRTPWNLFDVQQSPPTRFALGDQLHFYAISPAEFDAMKEVRT